MALVLGRRQNWPWPAESHHRRPHSLPFVLLGTALLWYGWFGFNAGSALRLDNSDAPSFANTVAYAFLNTNTSAAAGLLTWVFMARLVTGRATTLGAASGVVSGLVAITPCAGYVEPIGAAVIGVASALACGLAVNLKERLKLDDSLDVAGLHLVGGVVGSLCLGLLATDRVNPLVAGHQGLLYGGGLGQLADQAVTIAAVVAYSFSVTYVLGRLLGGLVRNRGRVSHEQEEAGLDHSLHGELAYTFQVPSTQDGSGSEQGESGRSLGGEPASR
jgi:ammonium transporter, Amt family